MPRTTINRSVSFDPQIFEMMESRRSSLLMDRSEYIKRCIMKDMMAGGVSMEVEALPDELSGKIIAHQSRAHPRASRLSKKK